MDAGIIRECRKRKGMTQSELAGKVGMRQNVLSNYENGKFNIERMPIREFIGLANVLEIPDECIYLDKSEELDKRMEDVEEKRRDDMEATGRRRRITKYCMDLAAPPATEGECLALCRVGAGFQANEVAYLLDIHAPVYNRYENNKRKIPYGVAAKLAYILGMRFEEIFDV